MDFIRSSLCRFEPPQCLEAAIDAHHVILRDSKNPNHFLAVSHQDWDTFIAGAKLGEFDFSGRKK